MVTRVARQTPAGARPNRRREAVLFDKDAAGRLLEGAGDRAPREMTVRGFMLRQNPAYRPGGSHLTVQLATVLLLATGACSAPIPRQFPTPIESPAPPAAPAVPTSWVIARDLLAREYLVEQAAEISITTDSGTSTDTSTLVVEATVRSTTGGGVSGLVRSASVRSAAATNASFPGVVLPLVFSGTPPSRGSQHQLTGRNVPADPCQSPSHVLLGSIRDLFVSLPDTVKLGTTWADSGHYDGCRGGARLIGSSVRRFSLRSYEVRDGQALLLVDHRSTSRLRGMATRSGDTTVVEGVGSGSGEFAIDAISGAIVSMTTSASLEISIRGAVRLERARQLLRTRIVRPGR